MCDIVRRAGLALATLLSASLPAAASDLYLAWRGPGNDDGIYAMRTANVAPLGNGFASWCKIPGVGTATGVSLTTMGNAVYMAWRGVSDDDNIYWSRLTSTDVCNGWEPQHRLTDRGTAGAPAVMEYKGGIIMVWRGVSDDVDIYWSRFDGNNWSGQQKIEGIGTDGSAVGRVARPGITVFNSLLYMAWRGTGGDENIYWTSFDGTNWNASPVQHQLSDRGTFAEPALATYSSAALGLKGAAQDTMIMVWPGVPGDLCMYFSEFDTAQNNFTPQTHMSNAMHTVQQAAMQYYRPSELVGGQVYSFRIGNNTFCQANPSDSDSTASLGAVDAWAPVSPPTDSKPAGWTPDIGPFEAQVGGVPGITVGP